jgi:hypothetical protein
MSAKGRRTAFDRTGQFGTARSCTNEHRSSTIKGLARRITHSAAAVLAVAPLAAAPAGAAFPGENGPIAYREFAPNGIGGPLLRALPDATPVGVIDSRPGLSRTGFDVEPKYSPNGRRIVFTRLRPAARDEDWQSAIMLVPAMGGRVRQLTPWGSTRFGELPEHPTWSPDSRWIVFDTDERIAATDNGSIEAIRPDGRGRHTILPARERHGAHKPWFSRDGSSILFVCDNKGLLPDFPADFNDDLCLMDADGSNVVNTELGQHHNHGPSRRGGRPKNRRQSWARQSPASTTRSSRDRTSNGCEPCSQLR